MKLSEYQMASKETAKEYADPDVTSKANTKMTAMFLATALNGETGELSEKLKKYVREDDPSYLEEAKSEAGDILWYWTQIVSLLDANADEIAEANLAKLQDREERDQILGDGDNR